MLLEKINEVLKKGYSIHIDDMPCNGTTVVKIVVVYVDRVIYRNYRFEKICALDESCIVDTINELVARHEERIARRAKDAK